MTKLVRDKIPEIVSKKNNPVKTKILNDHEYLYALNDKLQEEVSEFIDAIKNNDSTLNQQSEIADILEVVEAICKFKNYDKEVIQNIQQKKKLEKGGFDKRILLITEN